MKSFYFSHSFNFSLLSESSQSISKAELTIGAILDPDGGPGGRPLEVAYGRPEDACKLLNGTSCEKRAIEKGEIYKLKAVFDVPSGIPKVSTMNRIMSKERHYNFSVVI